MAKKVSSIVSPAKIMNVVYVAAGVMLAGGLLYLGRKNDFVKKIRQGFDAGLL